jgi:putative nucleotidyltransferase with HDIG domain
VGRTFRALVVHNQPEALGELVDLLTENDLGVETARSETEALHKISSGNYSIIISANSPPALSGASLLERSATFLPDAVRILMVHSAEEADGLDRRDDQRHPIIRFVGQASERGRLRTLVRESLKLLALVEEQKQLVKNLGLEYTKLQRREKLLDVVVAERNKELEVSYEKLKAANRQALFGLAEAIEAKDPYTKGHCGRVAAYSLVLAKEVGYSDEALETLEFGAFLHDIGKIGVRDSVLLKPGPLDEDEWQHMRSHPVKGYEIATKIEMLRPTMPAVRNHHERWDGKGYPDGMVGEDIPFVARIVAIADAFDAMATDRPYKRALPLDDCEALLRKNAGKMFDPDLVELFVSRHLGALYQDEFEEMDDDEDWDEQEPSEVEEAAAEQAATSSPAASKPAAAPVDDEDDFVIPGLDL